MAGRVAILDMQPIDPPTGGGRLRLLGLYHRLGSGLESRYVGSYDWPGPRLRRQMMSPTLEELVVPLSDAHFAAARAWSQTLGGKGVIDVTFHRLGDLSEDYVAVARAAAREADVVVFSHPWVFPLVRAALDSDRQLIVYDAHNVEGLLRVELLDDGGPGTEVAREAVRAEFELCHAAHLVLACSQEDRDAFVDLYGLAPERTRLAPNGAFTEVLTPPTADERAGARKALGLGARPLALFVGSNYGPNVDAARFVAQVLAPALPGTLFVVAGGVGDALSGGPANLRRTGLVCEEEKRRWLQAADLGLNPMFGGSGTNIKMLEFMAAGLPIVATAIGARGLALASESVLVADGVGFADGVAALLADRARAARMAATARRSAELNYSWERISHNLGELLARRVRRHGRPAPYFSVIVPTYERPGSLTELVERLALQTWTDFEVVIVDQSLAPWPDRERDFGLDIAYVHTDLRGAVYARNRAADLAAGRVLAFIDDDCRPAADWLFAAHRRFTASDVAGLEGLVTSDVVGQGHPDWRPVTNDGFEGIGFMTANLFVRADVFHRIGGFDVDFDHPHFREDTDLGWRIQSVGEIPFCREAAVYHPSQPRRLERESVAVRSAFFEKDALLLRKHPEKYVTLMRRERQWTHNPHFWTYFIKGLERYGVTPPEEVRALAPQAHRPAIDRLKSAG